VQRLSSLESHAKANDITEAALRAKHLAPGQRTDVTDTSIEGVRALAAAITASISQQHSSGGSGGDDVTLEESMRISAADVLKALKRVSAGSAPGPDGLCYEHLWAVLGADAVLATTTGSEFDSTTATPSVIRLLAQLFDTMLHEPHFIDDSCWRLWWLIFTPVEGFLESIL
jgi:hypothetical protein